MATYKVPYLSDVLRFHLDIAHDAPSACSEDIEICQVEFLVIFSQNIENIMRNH